MKSHPTAGLNICEILLKYFCCIFNYLLLTLFLVYLRYYTGINTVPVTNWLTLIYINIYEIHTIKIFSDITLI